MRPIPINEVFANVVPESINVSQYKAAKQKTERNQISNNLIERRNLTTCNEFGFCPTAQPGAQNEIQVGQGQPNPFQHLQSIRKPDAVGLSTLCKMREKFKMKASIISIAGLLSLGSYANGQVANGLGKHSHKQAKYSFYLNRRSAVQCLA